MTIKKGTPKTKRAAGLTGQRNIMTFFSRASAIPLTEKESQAKADIEKFRATVKRENPVAEEIVDDLDAFMQTDHTFHEMVVKLVEARNTYNSIQQIPGGWKFEVQGEVYEILVDETSANREVSDAEEDSTASPTVVAPNAAVTVSAAASAEAPCHLTAVEKAAPLITDSVEGAVPAYSLEVAQPNQLPPKPVSDFPVEFGFTSILSLMPAANSDQIKMPDSDARCQAPDSSAGHARCQAVTLENATSRSSDVGIRVEFGFAASNKPVSTSMQGADIVSSLENDARTGLSAQVEPPQLKVASEAEVAHDALGHLADQTSSAEPSSEDSLRAAVVEQPMKRQKLSDAIALRRTLYSPPAISKYLSPDLEPWNARSPSRSDGERKEKQGLGSDATVRMPSLRDRLLSRISGEGPTPPRIVDSALDEDTPAADNLVCTPASKASKARDHKSLGGLSFKWKLLFHAGAKPSKKGTSLAAAVVAGANAAKKASCKGGA